MRYYCAYGSNLWKEQMFKRCPLATIIGESSLENMRLEYRGSDKEGYYATVREEAGSSVPVVIYTLTEDDEKTLDGYEHVPEIYTKTMLDVEVRGVTYNALIYIMNDTYTYGIPSQVYFLRLLKGYRDYGLKETILNRSLALAYELTEMK